jgi:AAA15 family ATPase/GTPase
MIIQQFTLRDFKAHSETCLVFNGPLTLITGANNTGKTSVLEALQAFAECLAQTRKRVLRANHPGVRAIPLHTTSEVQSE